jgi:hypothetical protein
MQTIGYENAHYRVWVTRFATKIETTNPEIFCQNTLERFLVGLPISKEFEITDLNNEPVRRYIGHFGLKPLKGAVTHEEPAATLAPVDREPPVQVVGAAPADLYEPVGTMPIVGDRIHYHTYSDVYCFRNFSGACSNWHTEDHGAYMSLTGLSFENGKARILKRKAAPKPDVLQSARVFEYSRTQYATLTSGAVMMRCLSGSGRWFRDAYGVEQIIRTFRKDEITDPARVAEILDSLRAHLEGVK